MRRFLFSCGAVLVVLAASAAASISAKAACVASSREIRLSDGSARMKAYNCALADTGQPVLQVEFTRLSEAAAGSLIEGTPYKDMQAFYGRPIVVRNRVYAEAKRLFDTYGAKNVESDCYVLRVSSAEPGGSLRPADAASCTEDKRTLWYLNYPDREGLTAIGLPDSWRVRPLNGAWPADWRFFYTACGAPDLMSCTMMWRPVRPEDLRSFSKGVADSELKLGAPATDKDRSNAEYNMQGSRYLRMVADLARGQPLPEDFLVIVDGDPLGCGCSEGASWSGIHVRGLLLHAAFLRNVSSAPVLIDGLIEGADASEGLRPFIEGQTVPTAPREINPVSLAPGETMAVPLRLNFAPSGSWRSAFADQAAANATYARIHSSPRPTFAAGGVDCGGKTMIRRDSFGPPSAPPLRTYSYGPATTLKGVSVSGTPLDFDRSLANFLEIAAGGGYGSCPYLYAYDDLEGDWVRHGKIIDNASSPAKETTERRALPGLVKRFRIAEEELELTFVRGVQLELTLRDGSLVTLYPRNRLRGRAPDLYEKIKYGAARDYRFDLPPGLDPAAVATSTLAVTGFYIRYADADVLAASGRAETAAAPAK